MLEMFESPRKSDSEDDDVRQEEHVHDGSGMMAEDAEKREIIERRRRERREEVSSSVEGFRRPSQGWSGRRRGVRVASGSGHGSAIRSRGGAKQATSYRSPEQDNRLVATKRDALSQSEVDVAGVRWEVGNVGSGISDCVLLCFWV